MLKTYKDKKLWLLNPVKSKILNEKNLIKYSHLIYIITNLESKTKERKVLT